MMGIYWQFIGDILYIINYMTSSSIFPGYPGPEIILVLPLGLLFFIFMDMSLPLQSWSWEEQTIVLGFSSLTRVMMSGWSITGGISTQEIIQYIIRMFLQTILYLQELSPDQMFGQFWSFTWWEMGCHDLPKVMEYILQLTGHDKWVIYKW